MLTARDILFIIVLSLIASSLTLLSYHFIFLVPQLYSINEKFVANDIIDYCLAKNFYNHSRNITDLTDCIDNVKSQASRN